MVAALTTQGKTTMKYETLYHRFKRDGKWRTVEIRVERKRKQAILARIEIKYKLKMTEA